MIIKIKKHAPMFAIILFLFALPLSACSQNKDAKITAEEIVEGKTNNSDGNNSTLESDDSSSTSNNDNSENNISQEREWLDHVLSNDTGEIKVIVYNYKTNKNILVKNGDKVPFSKENDTLAFLIPSNSDSITGMSYRSLFGSAYARETTADDGKVTMCTYYFEKPGCTEESYLFHINFEIDEKPIDYHITLNFREGADEKAKEFNLDSTLPGLEWIATLDNVISQPTAIIYNDKTNKKILVEDKDEFFLSDPDDVIAYYSPNADAYPLSNDWSFSRLFETSWVGSDELPDASNSMRKILCYQTQLVDEPTNHDAMVTGHLTPISFPITFDDSGQSESWLEFYLYTLY